MYCVIPEKTPIFQGIKIRVEQQWLRLTVFVFHFLISSQIYRSSWDSALSEHGSKGECFECFILQNPPWSQAWGWFSFLPKIVSRWNILCVQNKFRWSWDKTLGPFCCFCNTHWALWAYPKFHNVPEVSWGLHLSKNNKNKKKKEEMSPSAMGPVSTKRNSLGCAPARECHCGANSLDIRPQQWQKPHMWKGEDEGWAIKCHPSKETSH